MWNEINHAQFFKALENKDLGSVKGNEIIIEIYGYKYKITSEAFYLYGELKICPPKFFIELIPQTNIEIVKSKYPEAVCEFDEVFIIYASKHRKAIMLGSGYTEEFAWKQVAKK